MAFTAYTHSNTFPVCLGTTGIGSSLYGVLYDVTLTQAYNATTAAFEPFNASNYTASKYCALTWVETGATGIYTMTMPAGIPTGYYWLDMRRRVGASPAQSDPSQLAELWAVVWDGTQVVDGLAIEAPMKRGRAFPSFPFTMNSASDHLSAFAGAVTGLISRDGGAPVALTNTPSLVSASEGIYKIDFTASEMDATSVVVIFSGTGADDNRFLFTVQQ